MGLTERAWDAFASILKLSDKVDQLTTAVSKQPSRIEDLNARVIRLEAPLEFAIRTKLTKRIPGASN